MKIREAQSDDAAALAELLADLGYPTEPEAVRSRLGAVGDGDLVLGADDGVDSSRFTERRGSPKAAP